MGEDVGMPVDVIAIDWSGRIEGERRTIWTAHARDGRLISLENGRRRGEVIDHVISVAPRFERLVVGLDFAFSFPAWFLNDRGLTSVHALWQLAGVEGEQWLKDCNPPFWGKPGRKRPLSGDYYRVTEREFPSVAGVQAKSVFQVGGAGAVGTGSVRGMPFLGRLHDAGFSIWPFDQSGWPRVIEIYPRLLTGPVIKSNQGGRERYLEDHFPALGGETTGLTASSEDAFDAAVSALVMSAHADELAGIAEDHESPGRLEGRIWCPANTTASTGGC